jgi:hypothetical protein
LSGASSGRRPRNLYRHLLAPMFEMEGENILVILVEEIDAADRAIHTF